MMHGLAHLVARATGQVKSGLSPRNASRFEGTSADWAPPVEISTETAAPDIPVNSPPGHMTNAPNLPALEAIETPAKSPMGPAVAVPQTSPSSAPLTPETAPLLSKPNLMSPPAPMHRALPPLTSVTPAITGPGATSAPLAPPLPQSEVAKNLAAPEPLLELQQTHPERAVYPDATQPENAIGRMRDHRIHPTPPAEPAEIVIHIGRLDVVAHTEPAKPVPQRPQRRPEMTRLGDYLKGKGGTA